MSVIIPRKHLRQPQGRLVLDRSSQLTSESLDVVTLAGHSRIITESDRTVSPNAMTFGVNSGGMVGKFEAAQARVAIANSQSYGAARTYCVQFESSATNSPAIMGAWGTLPRLLVALNASGQLSVTVDWNTAIASVSSAAFNDGRPHTLVFTLDGGAGDGTLEMWVDGRKQGLSSGGSGLFVNTTNFGAAFALGVPSGQSWSTNVRIGLFANWLRKLWYSEAGAISEAPWQLFRADPIRIYSLPTGAISINSILASNITQTGATITLGLTR